MLNDSNILSLPVLNSYYTENNIQNGVNPIYIQDKFLKGDTNKYPILVSFCIGFTREVKSCIYFFFLCRELQMNQ